MLQATILIRLVHSVVLYRYPNRLAKSNI